MIKHLHGQARVALGHCKLSSDVLQFYCLTDNRVKHTKGERKGRREERIVEIISKLFISGLLYLVFT